MYGMNYARARTIASVAALIGWAGIVLGLIVSVVALFDFAHGGAVPILSGLAIAFAGLLHVLLATVARAVLITAESSERIARNTSAT